MRSKTIPNDSEILTTFDELREFRNSFFNSEFYFLPVVGRPGLSKSWDFEERCRPYLDRNGQEMSVAHYIRCLPRYFLPLGFFTLTTRISSPRAWAIFSSDSIRRLAPLANWQSAA